MCENSEFLARDRNTTSTLGNRISHFRLFYLFSSLAQSKPVLAINAAMTEPFIVTADEVNCLIHAYFEDSG